MLLTYGDVLCYVSGGLCVINKSLKNNAGGSEADCGARRAGVAFRDGNRQHHARGLFLRRRSEADSVQSSQCGNLPDRALLLHPGLTLGEILELREVAGTSAMPGDASEARVAPAASRDVGKPKAPGCTSAKAQWQRHTQPGVQRSDTDCRDGRKPAHRPR